MRSRLALLFALLATIAEGSTHTCRWAFPGGTPATFEGCVPPPVTFATPGAKRVTLTVCAAGSCTSSTRTLQVLDPRPRIVRVTPPGSPVYPGDEVSVSAVVTGAPPLALSWKLPGGVTSTANPVVFRVPNTRRVSLSLSLTNRAGNVTLPVGFNVLDPRPRASIRLTPSPLYIGQTLTAVASVTGKPPFQLRWNLTPEGLASSGSTFSWPTAGAAAGNRRLSLTVTNSSGSQTVSTSIRLSPTPLIVSFKPLCPDLCFFPAGTAVPFELATSSGAVSRYEYDWNGDGRFETSSASPVSSHTFSAPGSYRPRIRVTAGARVESAYSLRLLHVSRVP